MDELQEDSFDMGFSDEEQDEVENMCSKSPPKDKNLDLLTMLLDDESLRSHPVQSRKGKKLSSASEDMTFEKTISDDSSQSSLLERMRKMEEELIVLRQKVKAAEQSGSSAVIKEPSRRVSTTAANTTNAISTAIKRESSQRTCARASKKAHSVSTIIQREASHRNTTSSARKTPSNGNGCSTTIIKQEPRQTVAAVSKTPGSVSEVTVKGETSRCSRISRVALNKETTSEKGTSDRNVSSQVIAQRHEAGVATEKYSGLRIKNPLVSSDQMKKRMEGRKMVRIRSLSSKMKNGDADGDWVTIGVVVDKLPPRDTVKGKKYSIWRLSDLSGQTAVISLFLFGNAFQSHWKTSLGTVVAILNPSIMSDKESSSAKTSGQPQNLALSIDNGLKLMVMGVSQDYTMCKGVTKAGTKCSNFASLSDGGFCDYHVKKAYTASRSQRMECQSGYGCSADKDSLKKKLFQHSKTEVFYYGGKSFSVPSKSSSCSDSGEKQASARLFAPGSSDTLAKMLESQSRGARILAQKNKQVQEVKSAKIPEKSPLELLMEHRSSLPRLGKGMKPGSHIELSTSNNKTMTANKCKAVKLVQLKGSADSKTGRMEKIRKRVSESRGDMPGESDTDELSKEDISPPPKKQKRNHSEIDRLLNAKSSHDWVNLEAEREREEEYFDRLEKKESIESKKDSIRELRVSVVKCKECDYTAESPGQLCVKEKHHLSRFKALKRGFACSKCSEKVFTYDSRWPIHPCKKCGANSFEHSSLYYERKGPALPTEQLLLRGIEEKFLR